MSAFIADKFADDCAVGTGSSGDTRRKPKFVRPVAPYHRDPAIAASMAFDRNSGAPVPLQSLKTYDYALAQYHLQSEAKFLNGKYLDRGTTKRRHIYVSSIRHIGKEAHDWEQQAYLGIDNDAQLDYGTSDVDVSDLANSVCKFIERVGLKQASVSLHLSVEVLRKIRNRTKESKRGVLNAGLNLKLTTALANLDAKDRKFQIRISRLKKISDRFGLRKTARKIGVDPSNLRRQLISSNRSI